MNSRGRNSTGSGWSATGWGDRPEVVLFVGGPNDGDIRDVGTVREVLISEPQVSQVFSWDSLAPVRTYSRFITHRYTRASVLYGGKVYSVMRHDSVPTRDLEYLVALEVLNQQINQGFNSGGYITAQQAMTWGQGWFITTGNANDYITGPVDTRTDEEKIAWVHNGKGKDFL